MDHRTGILSLFQDAERPSRSRAFSGRYARSCRKAATYTVIAGDTIAAIATKHGIQNSALVNANRNVLGSAPRRRRDSNP